MKPVLRAVLVCGSAWVVYALLLAHLSQQDPVFGFLVGRDWTMALRVLLLLVLRLFLVLCAPAWMLWRVVSFVEQRWLGRRP